MIKVLVLALAVAASNVAVGQWFGGRGVPGGVFWRQQALGFLFRFGTIFGGATWVWSAGHRMPEVVLFIVVGAVAQMVGQIYLLSRKR